MSENTTLIQMCEKSTLICNDTHAKTEKKYGTILYTFSNTILIKKQCVIACGVVLIMVMILLVILFFGLTSLFNQIDINENNNEIAKTKKAFENDIRFPNGMNYSENIKNIVPDDEQRWTDGIVYYSIDNDFNSDNEQLITNSLIQMSDEIGYRNDGQKCITFKKRAVEHNYLHFIQDEGCWSYIGMTGGKQEISIGDGCYWQGIIKHEVMHALGFWHEHVRPDRDQYVNIHRDNIEPWNAYNFDKLSFTRVMTPFDLDSILIYDNYAFSINDEPTITANNGKELVHTYLKPVLTELNRQAIRLLYKCSGPVTDTSSTITSTIKPTITSTLLPIITSTMIPSTTTIPTTTTIIPSTTITTTTIKTTTKTTTIIPTTTTIIPTTSTIKPTTTTTTMIPTTTTMIPMPTTMKPTTTTTTIIPTTTTTIKPTTTTEFSEFVCERDGFFANPRDCSRFYRCVQTGQAFVRYEFICSLGTVWSNLNNACVHGFNNNCPQ